jgi:hypothetical protein
MSALVEGQPADVLGERYGAEGHDAAMRVPIQVDRSPGVDEATVRASASTLTLINAADIALLLIVVWVMYAKPGA